MRLNGYATAHFGKCHEVPVWETSPAGPFDRWPTGNGFEHFYGFIGGETNQWYPDLVEGTTPVEPDGTPEEGYHLMPDLADQAIGWIRQQQALTPDRPFFLYFAPGATHAPHHVPLEWADKYKGRFDQGWDAVRERDLRPAEAARRHPADGELTSRHDEIPAWDEMDRALKPVLARQMEVYAGFLEYADHHVGRLVDAIDDARRARQHAGLLHHRRQRRLGRGLAAGHPQRDRPSPKRRSWRHRSSCAANIDKFGGTDAYNHYAVGWAHAMCTPYQWTKQVASHWGGTRNAHHRALAQPDRGAGEMRSQFCHVIDVAPTVLEAAGLPRPTLVNGVTQEPMHGREHALQLRRRRRAGAAPDASTSR